MSFALFAWVFTQQQLMVDKYLSPYSGAENLLTVEKFLLYQTQRLPQNKGKAPKILRRFTENVLVWFPLNFTSTVVQHEIFGHGFRAREFGDKKIKVSKYAIRLPPPYGRGGGSTQFHISDISRISPSEMLAMDIAGIEATTILARSLEMKWLHENAIYPQFSTLYFLAKHDSTLYIAFASQHSHHHDSNDIQSYVSIYNATHVAPISVNQLQNLSYLNFLDPMTFYSIASLFTYIYSGKTFPIHSIPLGSTKHLPAFHISLSPFGVDYVIENFMTFTDKPVYFYYKWNANQPKIYGLGIECPQLFRLNKLFVGLKFDGFFQPHYFPKMLIYYTNRIFDFEQRRLGMSSSCLLTMVLNQKPSQISLAAEIGAKMKGYVPGQTLNSSLIVRGGLSLRF